MPARKQTRNSSLRKSRSDFQRLTHRFMSGLLRSLFFINKPARHSKSGFVLPTTVLLLLMVTLTVGAMSYRTFSRTSQTIAYRNQQAVDSVATPAIDRAKAKIEFLLTKDASVADKRPPSSGDLLTALSAGSANYIIPGETQEDINDDGTLDNAWSFIADDGTKIVYSLTLDDSNADNSISIDSAVSDQVKADNFIVRNGPIDTTTPQGNCPVERLAGDGWQLTGARLAKNFQVDVLAIRGTGPSKTVSAFEYQQVRTASRGNRWGAWFRYDMEVSPGGSFRWNGAIHTEGSMYASASPFNTNKAQFVAYMISSEKSCVYDDDASVIEVSGPVDNNEDGTPEFLGQLVSGTVARSGSNSFFGGQAFFHTDTTAKDNTEPNVNDHYDEGVEDLTVGKDSVDPKDTNSSAADVAQDPVAIFTEDKFVHIDNSNNEDEWDHEADQISRVKNDDSGAARPFLDDGYRADNRYGPKPVYNAKNSFSEVSGIKLSTPHISGEKITDNTLLTKELSDTQDYGLDGYWERSAADQGLRLIVGQRLELGNMFGWGKNDDPLYPANSDFEVMKAKDASPPKEVLKGAGETLQMRSLRDNLAAVQSMAVYHSLDTAGGRYPLACMASTVHPGTQETLENSRTFDKYSYPTATGTETGWKTDFLTGDGTNGIEFSPPLKADLGVTTATIDGVSTEIMTTGGIATKWANALKNLAYFAGDPAGGTPSFSATQGKSGVSSVFEHPYPYMSMWGDFSILRRIFSDYNASAPLSIADQSTIHTAACTLGMLAHNINYSEGSIASILENSSINWTNFGNKVVNLLANPGYSSGILGRPADGTGVCYAPSNPLPNYTDPNWVGCPSDTPIKITNSSSPEYPKNYYKNFSVDEWLNALINYGGSGVTAATAIEIKLIAEGTQILRDRTLGFKEGYVGGDLGGGFDPSTGVWTNPSGSDKVGSVGNNAEFFTGCDPLLFEQGSAINPAASNSKKARLGLALIACNRDPKPKYPALYYIFPRFDHSHVGKDDSSTSGIELDHRQPTTTEDFFSVGGSYINTVNSSIGGTSDIYKAVDVSTIALTPYAPNETEWRTPTKALGASADFNFSGPVAAPDAAFNDSADGDPGDVEKNLSQNIIGVSNGTNYDFYQTSLLDKAIMDGRELLSVRLMDVDINLLTNVDTSDPTSGDTAADISIGGRPWIRDDSGIVYAFREDAVREDAIVRPYSSNLDVDPTNAWNACKTVKNLTDGTGDCHMVVNPSGPYDPPLNNSTGISPKPVDMVADPMRRPYGFRLSNGESLNRPDVTGNVQSAGMTFVTDNPIYIKGDFNLHAEKGANDLETALIEEFEGTGNLLGTTFANYSKSDEAKARRLFYGRDNLDERFARPNDDNWRPVEIFADSTTMLSNIFLDGWIGDYFTAYTTETRGGPSKNSSYLNANRPWFKSGDANKHTAARWRHEDADDVTTPFYVDRNGKTFRKQDNGAGDYLLFPKNSDGSNISFYVKGDKNLYELRQFQQPSPEATTAGTPKAPVRINALLIGGIVPAREGQHYGGLHNFPRLLEYWPNRQLVISGGFFQLNFSSQAVAPYDQDAWEAGAPVYSGKGQDMIKVSNGSGGDYNTGNQHASQFYYGAAERIWGYDVAFQYTPAGPIARRFVRLDRPRSEFYRELPVDDPYIQKLCAVAGGNC